MTTPEIVTLRDAASGDEAKILVSQGFNCFSWTRQLDSQQPSASVIHSLENHASGELRPSSGGIPILFPYPGRIKGVHFEWNSKSYELEPYDKLGNAIHGFLLTRPWALTDVGPTHATATFDSTKAEGNLEKRWPSQFVVTATYRLRGDSLRFEFEAANTGNEEMPYGLGLHPYFRMGVHSGAGSSGEEVVTIPVSRHWPLAEMIPTGLNEPESFGLKEGRPFAQLTLDNVFDHGPTGEGDQGESLRVATIAGATSRLEVRYDTDYPFCIVYTPAHREAICIEPYTCLPGSVAKGREGLKTGLRVLAPGEKWRTAVEYRWILNDETV